MIDDTLSQLTVNAGEEYHKLHTGEQEFELTDSRMKYYERQALTAIYEIGLGVIGQDEKPKGLHLSTTGIGATERNKLRASQRKAWAKACGVKDV